jgi:hypothetical protein
MTYMSMWFGSATAAAFLQGVWLGLCLSPPVTRGTEVQVLPFV